MLGMVLGRLRKILAKRTFMVPKLEMLLIFIFRRRRGGRMYLSMRGVDGDVDSDDDCVVDDLFGVGIG